MPVIDIRTDGSERVKYDYDGYCAYIRKTLLSLYPNFSAESHWHDDLEFIYVNSGTMDYNVNGEIVSVKEGCGIMVNARQLHYGFSHERNECDFLCVLLHPMMLCTSQSVDRDFVEPIISNKSLPYVLLSPESDWQRKILDCISEIHKVHAYSDAPLYIQNLFYRIWILLTENIKTARKNPPEKGRQLSVLKDMLIFIQRNFEGNISLGDIAAAGNVSKSACLTIFKKYLMDTPINYLIGYRLNRAAHLLEESDRAVSEIALASGFRGVSYFTETFRSYYGKSPTEYRKESTADGK